MGRAVIMLTVAPARVPRQTPESGKFWKEQRSRFKNIKKGLRKSFQQRIKMKEDKVKATMQAKNLLEIKVVKKREIRDRMEEIKKRKQENCAKSEIVQILKNPLKIKRMKRKQLKQIVKRDILQ